jgi:signal transduction histidine kinase
MLSAQIPKREATVAGRYGDEERGRKRSGFSGKRQSLKSTKSKWQKEYLIYLEHIFSTIRHDVGNTVNALKITLDVFHENFDQFDDAKKREYLRRGMEIVSKQQEYIEALKSYSGSRVKRIEEIAFTAFWRALMNMVSEKIEGDPVDLHKHVEMDACSLSGDMEALIRALSHVLDNAVEATENSDRPRWKLTATRSRDKAIILIKDYGAGIEDEHMSKIFYPFFTTKQGRMGMGLAIAQKLLGNMGGKIEVESTYGNGTEAKMILPLFSR